MLCICCGTCYHYKNRREIDNSMDLEKFNISFDELEGKFRRRDKIGRNRIVFENEENVNIIILYHIRYLFVRQYRV